MTTTTNFNLTKPGLTDNADINVLDANMDIIDTQMHANAQAAAAAQTTANAAIPDSQIGVASGVAGLDVNSKVLPSNVPVATTSAIGGVKVGTGINVAGDGTISTTPVNAATTTTLGTVIVGSGINVTSGGTISVPVTSAATGSALGTVELPSSAGSPATPVALYRAASVQESLITTTAATTVASFTPTANGNFVVYVYFRVKTAATNVTVTVTYNDAGGAVTNNLLPMQSEAIGSWSLVPLFINAVSGTPIVVSVTAGTANQVYASASVVGV